MLSTLLKFAGAVLTGSLGLLSEAIHSGTDIASSLLSLVGVRAADRPPDEDHPYGHGKIESLAGFGEATLLVVIAVYVVFEAVHRLISGSAVEQVPLGIAIMALSAVGALLMGFHVRKVAQEERSLALQGNAQHLFVDSVTSFAVLGSLLIVHFSHWTLADPIFAILLAMWMSWGAKSLFNTAFQELIDVALPADEVATVQRLVKETGGVVSYHRMRTRRVGSVRHIDLHIVVPREWDLVTAHDCADALEKRIAAALEPAHVVIHVDPFDSTRASHSLPMP